MKDTILVTGASGNLGSDVANTLLQADYNVKAATRNTGNIQPREHLQAVTLDFSDSATFDTALQGVDRVFLVAPPMDPEAPMKLIPFIKATKSNGIDHIVFNSALGVDQNDQAPLRIIELALIDSGIAYTILRPNFFMENFSTGFIAPMITHQAGIFLAAADGKTSFISTKDIAAVARKSFSGSLHGREFNLTGLEALDHNRVAVLIGESIGKTITYHDLPEDAMLQGARDQGMPEGAVQYLGHLYAAVRAGYTAAITDDVEKITGQTPVSFTEFVQTNTQCWM